MTTAVETVSAEIRRYAATITGGATEVPHSLQVLAQFVVGGLQQGESVLRAVGLRNPDAHWIAHDGIAVLTDRAVLLAEDEGPRGQRVSLWDIVRVSGVAVDHGGTQYPALEIFCGRVRYRIVAAPVDGWSYELARTELQEFGSAITAAAVQAKTKPRPFDDVPQGSSASGYAPSVFLTPAYGVTGGYTGTPAGQPPAAYSPPSAQRPRPHYIAGTFWAIIAFAALVAAVQGQPASLLVTLLAGAYSTYLYRGGRWVIFFF